MSTSRKGSFWERKNDMPETWSGGRAGERGPILSRGSMRCNMKS